MISLLIRLLLAYVTHSACDLGTSVDWYAWMNRHEAEHVASVSIRDEFMAWVYEADGETVVFVFDMARKPQDGDPAWHGECARLIG